MDGRNSAKPPQETAVLMCAEHVAQCFVAMKTFFAGSTEKITFIENFT